MLPKLLFYVHHEQLLAHAWRRGKLGPAQRFALDPEGLAAFGRYLDAAPGQRAYVVADMVEEDFQRHLLPHVGGRAGRALAERRLVQHYRDTPFRHAAIQDRDDEGRRDDHALFSALTNPEQLQAWIDVLEAHAVPLAGIYSAAWMSTLLVRSLALAQPQLLLITQQTGGLRQSYFQDRWLKFSRLTALAPGEDVVAATAAETSKMQQFLNSTRLLGRGELLRVVVLAPHARLAALEAACADAPDLAFHFIDLPEDATLTEPLLLGLVGRHAPPSQYPLGAAGRFYQIWQARLALNVASACAAVLASAWLLSSVVDTVQMGAERRRLEADTVRQQARYRDVAATLPPTPTRSANMKAAVLTQDLLASKGPAPAALLTQVSAALDRAPAVRINALNWQVWQAPVAAGPQAGATLAAPVEGPPPLASARLGLHGHPPQVLRIDGEIEAAPSDIRAIVETVNRFAADLASQPHTRVAIVQAPLDVSQNARLAGNAGGGIAARPVFAIELTWTPE